MLDARSVLQSLVLRAEETLRSVAAFLELPWDEAVLHHERYINQPNGVALSKYASPPPMYYPRSLKFVWSASRLNF